MQKVVFFTKSVSILGGKEKVLLNLANYLAGSLYQVSIITYDGSTQSVFPVHPSIKIATLPLSFLQHIHQRFLKVLFFLKDIRTYRALQQGLLTANYLIATDQIITTIMYYAFKKKRDSIMVWEHLSYITHKGSIWQQFIQRIYPKLKFVITLNKTEAEYYTNMGCTVTCLPNVTAQHTAETLSTAKPIVWAGALTKEKGTADIIAVARLLKKNNKPVQIHVYGTGDGAAEFANEILQHSLNDIIVLKKPVQDITLIYSNALALLVTSKHECFPTVILEAFSFGVPAISYNCPTGPGNIITDGVNGFLVPVNDTEGLYNRITKLTEDNILLQNMGEAAFKASYNYLPGNIYPRWNDILK